MKKYLFLAITALAVTFSACNSSSSNKSESAASDQSEVVITENQNIEHAVLGVKGYCDMCKDNIEKAANGVEGVTMASWDMESKELHMDFDPQKTNVAAVSQAIAKVGYETDMDKADEEAYNALPGCCKAPTS